MKKTIVALAVVLSLSGCERVGNAWNALTSSKATEPESAAPHEVGEQSASSESTSRSNQAPFTLEIGEDLFDTVQLVSTVDQLVVESIVANRGNCKLQENVTEAVSASELKSDELAVAEVYRPGLGSCHKIYQLVSSGLELKSCPGDLDTKLHEMGYLKPGMRVVFRSEGYFYVPRSPLPKTLKFAEKFGLPLDCGASNLIELEVGTNHGSYSWSR